MSAYFIRTFPRPGVVLLLGLLALAGGCGGGKKLYPVKGVVVFKEDNQPLTCGLVVFEPAGGGEELTARGEIQADGTFRLRTKDTLGAVEGKHRVLIQPADAGDDSRPAPRPFHPRFESFEKSKLEVTVTRDAGANDFTLVITRP